MSQNTYTAGTHRITVPALVPFVIITFSIPAILLGLYVFNTERMTSHFGEISGRHPFFIVSTYSPAIAAIAIVYFMTGFDGVKAFLGRLLLWRCPASWVGFLILGIPLTFAAGALLKGNLFSQPFPFENTGALLSAMVFMLFLGPVEEIGWRGMSLPILQRYMAPIWAGLLVGAVWAAWHLPAFFLSGTAQSAWSITPFMIGTLCLSVIVTPLFNVARGSILLPALFHFQLINPIWPDAQPYDTWLFFIVAVMVVWLNRRIMFSRTGAVTKVVPCHKQCPGS